jgi:hypothetical protein
VFVRMAERYVLVGGAPRLARLSLRVRESLASDERLAAVAGRDL